MATTKLLTSALKTSPFRVIASGLQYPEGPVYRPDGSLVLVEIGGQKITRIAPDGSLSVIANLPGGPNGLEIGPDGALYVCNNGGLLILPVAKLDPSLAKPRDANIEVAIGQSPLSHTGSIQRVGTDGTVTTLYTQFQAKNPFTGEVETLPLRSPDDLVFDSAGCFWFTDWGKDRWRDRDITGVYYAHPDGSSIEEKIFPLKSPNGIGLSPDESRLYVAESFTRRILFWELSGPGTIKPNPRTVDGSHLLTAKIPYQSCLDSMAVDEAGNVYIASFLPKGADPDARGGVSVIAPNGEILEWIEIDLEEPEPLPSNLCFGGPDRRTMYVTLGGSGRVAACQMRIPGKKLAWG